MTTRLLRLAAIVGAGLFIAAAAPLPRLTGRVVDAAQILPASTEAELTRISERHEAKTGNQLVVVTAPRLDGEPIEEFGVRLGRAWGIGQAGKNNGVLLIVAPNDRQVRIEVGYGLEGDLPDAVARLIIESSILPRFRAGDIPGGVRRGFEDVVAVLEGDAAAYKEQALKRIKDDGGVDFVPFLFVVAVFLFILLLGGAGPPSYRPYRGGPSGGFRTGGWSGGGGFSGGGGSFGGGGASGRW